VAAGTTGALVAQGANSNGWLEDEPVVSGVLAGVTTTGVDLFSILFTTAPSPVDQCGSYLEKVEPQTIRVSLPRSAVTITW
jgi:hypothetical protein